MGSARVPGCRFWCAVRLNPGPPEVRAVSQTNSVSPSILDPNPALKRTPLHVAHRAGNARMVDFGGWDMPLHYGSQVDEHHLVRRAAGVFDVSHMRGVDLTGADAQNFLRRLIANDVVKLNQAGKALYSCMLNPAGGVIDDLIVYALGENRWRLVVNAACADTDIAWMREVATQENFSVYLHPRIDLAMLAVQGPHAREALARTRPDWVPHLDRAPFTAALIGEGENATLLARTGYTGEDGYEIMLPADDAAVLWQDLLTQGVRPCGLGARDTLRLEAGMNLYGQDMDAQVSPLDAGLAWTVDRRDPNRDFIGRKALDAAVPQFNLMGLVLKGRGVLRAHMPVRTPHGSGELTSGTFSPTLNRAIGMVRLPRAVAVGDVVEVEVRGQWLPAHVVKLPFVRQGRVLIETPPLA